ncbi:MAG: sulfatase-like hydrolase/transferase [Opitutae bacterium]|nr:sulfatase-like hydrolase/transferase [Opitutae bacterium]
MRHKGTKAQRHRDFNRHIGAFLAAVAVAYIAPLNLLAKAPNVIMVLTDDQGYGDFSINGNPVIKTPNIDALGHGGVRFTDFHVAPMCTPTRSQLMTGLDAMQNGAMNVSSGRSLMDASLKTMANVFKEEGYATGLFGKWHLGDNYPYRPEDRGFDEAIWFPSSHVNSVADYWDNDYFDDFYMHNGRRERFNGYCTDVFFDEAINWMKKQVDASEPFFTFIPLNAAHWPPYVPDKYRGPAREALEAKPAILKKMVDVNMNPYYGDDNKEALVTFLAMALNIDENVGKLMQYLESDDLLENTIVIFFTDNGSSFGRHYYNAGMIGGKQELWEGGHRVPLFIHGPEKIIGEPSVIDELCHAQDILPTLSSLIGVEEPLSDLDGVDLLPLMKGETESLEDRMLVINYTRTNNTVFFPDQDNPDNRAVPKKNNAAVLWKKWRFLNNERLYDVSKDPSQDTDVASQYPEVVEAMRNHLDNWWDEIEDDAHRIHRIVIGSPKENPTMLTACDWYNVFIDMQKQVRAGSEKSGYWHVVVDRPGLYDFELRRWPIESGYGLNDSISETRVFDGVLPPGVALPIASARIMVGDEEQSAPVTSQDKSARFTFQLEAGETSILTYFDDANGERIVGAYFLYVNRKG